MSNIRATVFIEDLVGSKIVTADGKKVGRVVDIQITSGAEYEVSALIFGESAWLYRFHVLRPFAKTFGLHLQPRAVSWNAVARFERFVVTLKPGHESKIKSGDVNLHS